MCLLPTLGQLAIVALATFLAVVLSVLARRHGRELPSSLSPDRRVWGWGISSSGLAAVVVAGMAQWTPVEEPWIVQLLLGSPAMLVTAIVLAPLTEELVIRGLLFGALHRRNRALAYGVSTVLFAAGHGNPSGLPAYLLVGALLAYVYERTGKPATPIVAHALYNLVAILPSYL